MFQSNQLRLERIREGRRVRQRRETDTSLQSALAVMLTYGTHWDTLTHTHTTTDVFMHTDAPLLSSPCPSWCLCRPVWVIVTGTRPGSALSVILHDCTTVEWLWIQLYHGTNIKLSKSIEMSFSLTKRWIYKGWFHKTVWPCEWTRREEMCRLSYCYNKATAGQKVTVYFIFQPGNKYMRLSFVFISFLFSFYLIIYFEYAIFSPNIIPP